VVYVQPGESDCPLPVERNDVVCAGTNGCPQTFSIHNARVDDVFVTFRSVSAIVVSRNTELNTPVLIC
jgi:hypothetical protein